MPKDIEALIKEIVSNQLGCDIEVLEQPNLNLKNDLGADSLDQVELTLEIEEEFDVTLSDDRLDKVHTIGDLLDYAKEVIAAKGGP